MEQLELVGFEKEYVTIHEDSVKYDLLYRMSLNHPTKDVFELCCEIKAKSNLSLAEVLLTSNVMLCRRIRVERLFDIKVNDSNEKILEKYINTKRWSMDGPKKEILFRYSGEVDKTNLLCQSYLQIKKSLPHMEEFTEQKKLRAVSLEIRKYLISEITKIIMERLTIFIEHDRKFYMSYLEIKNCLPRGVITTQKAIEIAKEINKQCAKLDTKVKAKK